jgi:methionyl-tRNA formyltransferase
VAPIDSIVFFGTPQFAVPSLEALVGAGRRPRLVVSQPARPAGRGRRLVEPPVAARARELGLQLIQPERVRDEQFLERVAAVAPDLAVVVAFGQIFPPPLLDLPRLGCLNLHASLLPRWRGAAPIAAAIAARDGENGVSIQRMARGVDTGPVYLAGSLPIGPDEDSEALTARLSNLGAELLLALLPRLEAGEVVPTGQDDAFATLAPKLAGPRTVDLDAPALEISREVRAYGTEPGVTIELRGERLKLLRTHPAAHRADELRGAVVAVDGEALVVGVGDGEALAIERVQRAGGRPISGRDLANGLRLRPGERLW